MATALLIALFVFGLAIGSFLNVLVWRYKPDEKLFNLKRLSGRSHCPYCGHELGVAELVPILSFIFQKGKCRKCGHRLSPQYSIVEFLGGAIFAGVPLFLNGFYNVNARLFSDFSLSWWYYAIVLLWIVALLVWLTIAVIDIRDYIIPNELNLLLICLGVAIATLVIVYGGRLLPFRSSFLEQYQLIFSPFQSVIWNKLLGMAFGGFFFGLLVFLSQGKGMGMGDVKMALASGLILGWPDIALTILLSFILGGIVGGILLAFGKKHIKDKLPFAPFFVLAVFLTVFLGHGIISGYFSLFRI